MVTPLELLQDRKEDIREIAENTVLTMFASLVQWCGEKRDRERY